MDKFALGIAIAFFSAQAPAAEIRATNDEDQKVVIALDEDGVARLDGNKKSYPTIKKFREVLTDYFYVGNEEDVKALLTDLVAAADGDGDSYATLDSLERDAAGKFTVTATIEQESGVRQETFEFTPCKGVQN